MAYTAGIAAIVGAVTGVAGTAYTIAQGKPKVPNAPAATQMPSVDAFRRKDASAMAPGAAMSGNSSTLLGGSGPSQNVGTSTLLGQ
jgi:hypothetical protein